MFGLFGKSTPIVTLTPQEAQHQQKDGAALVDVRELYEWQQGHIPGALHMPLSSFTHQAANLPADKEVIFYCLSGYRSKQAIHLAHKMGLPHNRHMGGGIGAWRVHRLPIA